MTSKILQWFVINNIKTTKLVIRTNTVKRIASHLQTTLAANPHQSCQQLKQIINEYAFQKTFNPYSRKRKLRQYKQLHKYKQPHQYKHLPQPTSSSNIIMVNKPGRSYLLEHFNNFAFIGKGGFGSIYKAQHVLDKQMYAIKAVQHNTIDTSEICTLASLHHPNITSYMTSWVEPNKPHREPWPIHHPLALDYSSSTDSCQTERSSGCGVSGTCGCATGATNIENPYMVYIQMELCNMTLTTFLEKYHSVLDPYQPYVACHIIQQILSAVMYMHHHSYIHCDIKPCNVLIKYNYQNDVATASGSIMDTLVVKLSDFGLTTHIVPSTLQQLDTIVPSTSTNTLDSQPQLHRQRYRGTALYAAPEQYNKGIIDRPSDIYSIGLVLFEMLYRFETTMEKYVAFNTLKHNRKIINARRLPHHYSELNDLVRSMTSKHPHKRPSAKQAHDVLTQIAANMPHVVSTEGGS